MDVVNQLNEEELEKVSEMLRVSEAMDKGDAGFGDEEGGADGEYEGQQEDQEAETVVNSEAADQVSDLHEVASGLERVTVHCPADDQASSVSRQMSVSSKSAIASLSKQLEAEKYARKKLERELQQLHMVSSEIHKKLTSSQ